MYDHLTQTSRLTPQNLVTYLIFGKLTDDFIRGHLIINSFQQLYSNVGHTGRRIQSDRLYSGSLRCSIPSVLFLRRYFFRAINLTSCIFIDFHWLSNEFLTLLPTMCPRLTKLSLRGCNSLTSRHFSVFSESLPHLRTLDISYSEVFSCGQVVTFQADAVLDLPDFPRVFKFRSFCSRPLPQYYR